MPKYTENLNLFKYDVPNDGNRPFDIETSLNENWDKIDTFSQENNLQNKITNCITEIPQRINLELNNGILTLKAGSIVTVPNGFEADGTTLKFNYVATQNDITCPVDSNYFYIPASNGITFRRASLASTYSGGTPPDVSGQSSNYAHWYDTANNLVKFTNDKGVTWTTNNHAFPLGFTDSTGSSTIFQGFGFIGSAVWIDKGVKILIPNGKNKDGTLKNTEFAYAQCIIQNLTGGAAVGNLIVGADKFTTIERRNCYTSTTAPQATSLSGFDSAWFNLVENKLYTATKTASVPNYIEYNGILINTLYEFNGTRITSWVQPQAVSLTDISTQLCNAPGGSVSTASNFAPAVIVENYRNGTSWYRVWSDGWIEQGGYIPKNSGTSGTITFVKSFTSTNYTITSNTTNNASSHSFIIGYSYNHTESSVTWYKTTNGVGGNWYACGY